MQKKLNKNPKIPANMGMAIINPSIATQSLLKQLSNTKEMEQVGTRREQDIPLQVRRLW